MAGESDFKSKPIWDRIRAWLTTCNCDCGDKVYCTYCEMLMDAGDYIQFLEQKIQSLEPKTESKVEYNDARNSSSSDVGSGGRGPSVSSGPV